MGIGSNYGRGTSRVLSLALSRRIGSMSDRHHGCMRMRGGIDLRGSDRELLTNKQTEEGGRKKNEIKVK